jgi:molybdopterin synthase sulfur carrier subunit
VALGAGAVRRDLGANMRITVRYFASLREALGASESLDVPAGTTLGALRDRLIAGSGVHGKMLARGRALRCALNQAMSDESAVIPEGAEVAFFPPVTGG